SRPAPYVRGLMLRRVLPVAALLAFGAMPLHAQSSVPTPSDFLHLTVGADRTLADWQQITAYFARLASSPAVHVDTLGATTNGQPFILAAVSSPENIRRLPEIRANQALLADPRRLD